MEVARVGYSSSKTIWRQPRHGQPIFGNVFVKQDASQACQRSFAFEKRASAQILAIKLDQVERVKDCCSSGLSTGQLSNRDKPSGPSTTASPSIVKLSALMDSAAVAIAASRTVQA
jgi:hypothetical protein